MENKYAVQTIKIARVFPKIYYERKRLLIMYSQNNILSPYIPCRLSESSGQKYLLSKKNNAKFKWPFFFLFRNFLVYVSERKNMLLKNMLLKKQKKHVLLCIS